MKRKVRTKSTELIEERKKEWGGSGGDQQRTWIKKVIF